MAKPEVTIPGTWTKRRRFLHVVTAFCMIVVMVALLHDRTSTVAETAVTMAFTTIMAIVGAYVGGATWDHMKIRDAEIKGWKKDADAP